MIEISIKISNLTIGFTKEKPVLQDVNLEIQEKEFVLVLGPSGGGKSVFSLCLNGIIPQVINVEEFAGEISVFNNNPATTPIARMATEVGLVFQDPDAQLCSLCVEDEIVFGMENLKFPRELIKKRLEWALNIVGLQGHRDAYTWGLSGGQKQRVAIASVIAMQPKVLILDEPTSNLDPQGAKEVVNILKKIREETDITIIAIDHRVDDLIEHVDRMLIFSAGKIIYNDAPRVLLEKYTPEFLAMGVNVPQIAELVHKIPADIDDRTKPFPLGLLEGKARLLKLKDMVCPPPVNKDGDRGLPVVAFRNVEAGYPRRPAVLKNINLDIYANDFLAIIGQNGAGKTTLTKLLIGLQKPTGGKIEVLGQDILKMDITSLTEKVGYVFQYPDNQLVTDNVYDEVAYSLRLRGIPEEQVQLRVQEALATVGLEHLVNRHPLTLSMGEKRRLSIATMLILDQEILIMDEPTMGLDWGILCSVMNICRQLHRAGKTIIIVTHDMRCVAEWTNRVLVMDDGQIVFDGQPREFFCLDKLLDKNHLGKPPICELSEMLWPETGRVYVSNHELLHALNKKDKEQPIAG